MMNYQIKNDVNIWELLKRFNIPSLKELTKLVMQLDEDEESQESFPDAYKYLKEFEGMLRWQQYAEWHAKEFEDGSEAA